MEVRKRQYNDLYPTPVISLQKNVTGKVNPSFKIKGNYRSVSDKNKPESIDLIQENFHCSRPDAEKISQFWHINDRNQICNGCAFKWKNCHACVTQISNKISRKLYLAIQKMGLKAEPKRRINVNGISYPATNPIDFDEILAVPEFFINVGNNKLCLFIEDFSKSNTKQNRNVLKDHKLKKQGYNIMRIDAQEINSNWSSLLSRIMNVTITKRKRSLSPRMQRLQTILG